MPQDPNKNIAQEINDALGAIGLSAHDKKKIGEDLAGAIYLNLLDRLYKELPEGVREDFIKNVPDDPQKTASYFGKFIDRGKLSEAAKSSAREILDKFIERI